MNELDGGLATGSVVPPRGVDVLTGELLTERGSWNDHTQSWEIVRASRVEKTHGLVQQRAGSLRFSREYERYRADVESGDNTRGLLGGVDNPADADQADLRGGSGDGPG